MVLTVTLNPLLEKKYFFKKIEGNNNRAYKEKYLAGGKGINVSRQLNVLGIKNHALTFLGKNNGKILRSILQTENINFSTIDTKAETREATLIFDESRKKLSTFFGINSDISNSEIEKFIIKLKKAISNSSIVLFSGSLPNDECSQIIEEGIKFCNQNDKISILDSYGQNLEHQLSCSPTIIHNNLDELENSLNIKLKSQKSVTDLLNNFYKKNIKLSFLTAGKDSTYASKSDFHYKIKNARIEEKDSTGSGDAFVSGIIYGLEKSMVFNDFVKLASALGFANALSWDVCQVKMEEAQKLLGKILITEIGKKYKVIDDSPTI
ncbi:MAG: 1-phosphofructokinase [Ignavibacteriae bacterium]|nr:MAG: 1-phosphofructokinase [Ignavibacteriota bacterium]